jgi:hypothetical protein
MGVTVAAALDNARVGDVPDALLLAKRPGAAVLFLAVCGLIEGNVTPDEELHRLGRTIAEAGLRRIEEERAP